MNNYTHNLVKRILGKGCRMLYVLCLLAISLAEAYPQSLTNRYNSSRPLIVVCDWDKPPYEFRNDRGQPAGSNIDLLKAITHELNIPCEFVMKEWTTAIKTFERGEADLILANVRRYKSAPYFSTENIINFNRICVAMVGDSATVVTKNKLMEQGVVLKYGDYVSLFFRDEKDKLSPKVEFQSPKVALQGLLDGDYKYFVWGEEPLKWKIKELNLQDITINDIDIPISEIHIIGRDSVLIEAIDDHYSRLNQSGEVQRIKDRWLHPERVDDQQSSWLFYYVLIILLLAAFVYILNRMAKAHVKSVTRHANDLNNMMYRALHMGNIHVMTYDIRRDLMTNSSGKPILPEKGITLEEFTERIHPHEVNEFRQKMQMLMSGRERHFELKKQWRPFDDATHWLSLEGHAIVELDHEGHPAYIINAVSDVTTTDEDDRSVREQFCKYKKLANMPFIAMSFYDKTGYLLSLNDAMKRLCGFSTAANNNEAERYWHDLCMFDAPLFRNIYYPNETNDLLVCQHMDYPEINIDNYIETHVRPLISDDGHVANYFITAIDRTEGHDRNRKMRQLESMRSQTQQDIERYERWLNNLTKEGHTYLWHSDIAKREAYFFRSLQATDPNDFIVMPFETQFGYMPEEERDEARHFFTNQDPSQKPFCHVFHFLNTVFGSGESWFLISGMPIQNEKGEVTGHRGQSIDITQEMITKKKLEEEQKLVDDSVRLKSGFMASMTHELRTPLNAIIGFTQILDAIDTPEERSEYIRIIRNNCDMLQRLINDILTASSLNQGPTSIEEEDVDFSKEFNDICFTLRQRVEEGVDFIKENPYHNFYTRLDKGRVAQVLTNFVTNAVKFTKEGYIKVGYRYEQHHLYLYCSDTGAGIPKDKQKIIFDRFVKLDEFVQGTGMGLSICKTIAERLGGEIGVDSEGKGRGSTFWMRIPCERILKPISL